MQNARYVQLRSSSSGTAENLHRLRPGGSQLQPRKASRTCLSRSSTTNRKWWGGGSTHSTTFVMTSCSVWTMMSLSTFKRFVCLRAQKLVVHVCGLHWSNAKGSWLELALHCIWCSTPSAVLTRVSGFKPTHEEVCDYASVLRATAPYH